MKPPAAEKPRVDVGSIRGLTAEMAAQRLASEGANTLPRPQRRSWVHTALAVLREPMFLLLLGAAAIYLVLGDRAEAILLGGAVVLIISIELVQQRKTEHALEALRDLSSPRAQVVRDGEVKRIAGSEVVTGDMLIVSEGDRVAADGRLLWSSGLAADESLLTGESAPVVKESGGGPLRIYSGTIIVQGHGVAEVESTGVRTLMGRIGVSLKQVETPEPSLNQEVRKLVRLFGALGATLCVVVALYFFAATRDWVQGALAGITLAISLIPEEFPVILTVFLALGAWRMARRNVLTRDMRAVETLGAATVLCSDKTGTMTLNQMRVRRVWAQGRAAEINGVEALSPEFHELIEYSMLASKAHAVDPMENAFHELAGRHPRSVAADGLRLWREYPLSGELLAMSQAWRRSDDDEGSSIIAAKGAPEAIFELCGVAADPELQAQLAAMTNEGLRVLAVARAEHGEKELPQSQRDFRFQLLGLMGLEDPVRPGVTEAVAHCREAGVRVVMITGDHPATALNIGRQIGLTTPRVVTTAELAQMSDGQLDACVTTTNIFARVTPQQKLRLVEALQRQGEIVAMTGDGVNDSPALKAANIGVAMGKRGTDVAREAAGLVLLDDDFTSIVAAVRMGRRIFDNIRRAMAYVVALHVPLATLAMAPVLFGWPMLLFPMHIVFFELVTDPACSIVFEAEPESEDIMRRPPRDSGSRILTSRMMAVALLQGAFITATVFGVVWYARLHDYADAHLRALSFATLIVANLGLIAINRSWAVTFVHGLRRPNPAFWYLLGGSALMLLLVLEVPWLRSLFSFSPLSWKEVGWCSLAGVMSVVWFEILKVATGERRRPHGSPQLMP